MTPETISAIHALVVLIERIGSWPVGMVLLLLFLAPWLLSFWITRTQEKTFTAVTLTQKDRFETVVQMYKNNVHLCESFEKLAQVQDRVIQLNTAHWATALEKIDRNQFCPLVRTEKKIKEDVG